MNTYQKKKLEKEQKEITLSSDAQKGLPEQIERQVAWAAGTERFQHRDPSFHLSESFKKQFDYVGKERARAAGQEQESATALNDISRKARKDEEIRKNREDYAGHPWFATEETDMGNQYVARYGDEDRIKRFSEIGFQRGNLASAIINGTGRMMMVSCLKRTVGQENAKALRERKLFQMHSQHRLIPESQGSLGIVNKGFADSAVGMVIDVVKDARRSLDNMEKMVVGDAFSEGMSGTGTLWKMYPFLDRRREEMLLSEYEKKLKDPNLREGSEERNAVLMARERIGKVLRKKEQTRREFLVELRKLRDRAVEAELLFSKEDLLTGLVQTSEAVPPEDGKPEKPSGRNSRKNGNNKEEKEETSDQ